MVFTDPAEPGNWMVPKEVPRGRGVVILIGVDFHKVRLRF